MYVPTYVRMYVPVYVGMYVLMHVRAYVCVYIYIYIVGFEGHIGIVEKKMETTMSYGFGIWGFRTCLVHLGLRNITFLGITESRREMLRILQLRCCVRRQPPWGIAHSEAAADLERLSLGPIVM